MNLQPTGTSRRAFFTELDFGEVHVFGKRREEKDVVGSE